MDEEAALDQFELTYGAARMNLRGVDEDLALQPTGKRGNSINRILGQVVAYRLRLLRSLGHEPTADEELLAPYGPESEVRWTPERAVPLERLGGLLSVSHKALSSGLEARRCLGLPGVITPSDAPGAGRDG